MAIIGIIVCCDKRVRATGSDARNGFAVIATAATTRVLVANMSKKGTVASPKSYNYYYLYC